MLELVHLLQELGEARFYQVDYQDPVSMFLAQTTQVSSIISPTSLSSSLRVRSSPVISLSEPTGHKMLVFMNSPWVLLDRKLRDVTHTFMYSKTENGRSVNIIHLSCRKPINHKLLLNLKLRTYSNFGTVL